MVSAELLALSAAIAVVAVLLAGLRRLQGSARAIGSAIDAAVQQDLADAFIFVDGARVLRWSAVLALAMAALAFMLRLGPVTGVVLAGVLLLLPRCVLGVLRRRRQARLLRQLPDAMQALAALLRSGHSLGQGLAALAETQPRPLRDEWRLLLRRLRMGERPDAVFDQLPVRFDAPEARLFATTIRVAIDLGGSLAEALDNLAHCTRQRLEMQQRIRALTAQGRLQGVIVGSLPLLLLVALTLLDHDAMQLLWTRPAGWAALALICVLEICGFVMIRRIVRIDV